MIKIKKQRVLRENSPRSLVDENNPDRYLLLIRPVLIEQSKLRLLLHIIFVLMMKYQF